MLYSLHADHGGTFFVGDKMKAIKPFLSYEDQIDYLMELGLHIDDRNYAIEVLSSINYYRLINAYGLGLYRDKEKTEFKEGTTFYQIYSLYKFDETLRHIMSELLESFEIMFRTKLAYYLGEHYGALGYLDPINFENQEHHAENMAALEREMETQSKSPIVKHHEEDYEGVLPIWAAVEILSFGTISKLYNNMILPDKNAIAKQLSTSTPYLESWLRSFVEVRNICAHYGRLYNKPLLFPPKLHTEVKSLRQDRIFSVLYTLKRFAPDIQWISLMLRLKNAISTYIHVRLSFIGFPKNWEDLLDVPIKSE